MVLTLSVSEHALVGCWLLYLFLRVIFDPFSGLSTRLLRCVPSLFLGEFEVVLLCCVFYSSNSRPCAFHACSPDEVFGSPDENDGEAGSVAEGGAEFAAALDEVRIAVVRSEM